jgi:hypothetical protein
VKVSFSPDKRSWHPSVLPGQIVLGAGAVRRVGETP